MTHLLNKAGEEAAVDCSPDYEAVFDGGFILNTICKLHYTRFVIHVNISSSFAVCFGSFGTSSALNFSI